MKSDLGHLMFLNSILSRKLFILRSCDTYSSSVRWRGDALDCINTARNTLKISPLAVEYFRNKVMAAFIESGYGASINSRAFSKKYSRRYNGVK